MTWCQLHFESTFKSKQFISIYMSHLSNPISKPLLDVATAQLIQSSTNITDESIDTCRNFLEQYINNEIKYDICCKLIDSLIPNSNCVHEVMLVLSTKSNKNDNCEEESDSESEQSKGKTRLWSKEEDRRLLHAITIFGLGKWKDICVFVGGGRSRAQCSQRWYRSLDPRISKDRWTADEDARLLQSVAINGDHTWTKVAQDVKTRSDVQCRYRYNQIQKSMSYTAKTHFSHFSHLPQFSQINQSISLAYQQQMLCQQLMTTQLINNMNQQFQNDQIPISNDIVGVNNNSVNTNACANEEEEVKIMMSEVDNSIDFSPQYNQVTISSEKGFGFDDNLLDQIIEINADFENDFQDYSRDFLGRNLFDF
ncbi:Myb-like protein [Tritrichomonas foetus]|uniref:Myb-like protein n=1 Tax=Tritrichomonas foetus TaxID=1144522 RepID=A0A1J4L5Y8_9EUKA|nr:Myb-like protein [Tritrichomonas foetus]|eukprot:OHT17428.1 Myb-like protein [Tritrichomonas foetus]